MCADLAGPSILDNNFKRAILYIYNHIACHHFTEVTLLGQDDRTYTWLVQIDQGGIK